MEISKGIKALWLFALAVAFSITGCSDSDSVNTSRLGFHLTWMTENYSDLKNKPLKDIVIPGSHDSGMSVSQHCYYGDTCNTKAQTHDMKGQLERGVRYLDFRPARLHGHGYHGTWFTGHFSHSPLGWVGCMGQSGDGALDDIRDYVSEINKSEPGNKELIIVDFSHCYKIYGEEVYAKGEECDNSDWHDLIYNEALSKLSEYMLKCPEGFSVESTPYDTLMQGGGHIIFLVEHDSILTDYSQGIINKKDFPIYNNYSNTTDLDEMMQDQACKLSVPANHDNKLFLLSWTLTLDTSESIHCTKSIIERAEYAKQYLIPNIDEWITTGIINNSNVPNIVYTDASDGVATQAAVQLNTRNLKPRPDYPMGYWTLRGSGYVKQFGKAICYGIHPFGSDYFVAMAVTPTGKGYWLMTDTGGINCYGDAEYYGHHSGDEKFAAMAVTPTGKGYWLMSKTGGINCYGDAEYYGHHSGDEEFVAMAVTPTGKGYWLLSRFGEIKHYGDAIDYGGDEGVLNYMTAIAAAP